MAGTLSPGTVSTKQLELTQRAKAIQGEALTTLSHLIDLEWLREAYRRTRKDGASGVDGQTAKAYEEQLEQNSLEKWSVRPRHWVPTICWSVSGALDRQLRQADS